MKTACIYHSIDLDGWMSAAIVKHWFNTTEVGVTISKENSLDFIGYNYGQPIPDLSSYDKVVMCDISFPKEEMERLYKRLETNFIWIDHHISAIKDNIPDNHIQDGKDISRYLFSGSRDTKFSACELTWKYFFPNETMPEIVRLLGRYDCFGHKTKVFEMTNNGLVKAKEFLKEINKLEDFEKNITSLDGFSLVYYANDIAKKISEEQKVLEFQYGARQCISNYEEAYAYLIDEGMHFKNPEVNTLNIILDKGKSIYQYLCAEAKQAYKNGFEIKFEIETEYNNDTPVHYNKKFICINKERFNPINFGIDYHKDGYDGCACFYFNGIDYIFSLYNDNGLVDCSVIAKQFGGGGHKGAAGFVIKTYQEFEKLID